MSATLCCCKRSI